jgi:hypothetical protein
VTLVANKLRAIVPFDTCVIYLVDDPSGKAIAAHVVVKKSKCSSAAHQLSATASRLGDRQLAFDV